MSVIKRIRSRGSEYENRTGDMLPLNVLAKVSWIGGIATFAAEMASNGSAKDSIIPAALTVGGVIADKLTGGLGAPYPKNQVEESELN